jgi:deoxyribonuclease-4
VKLGFQISIKGDFSTIFSRAKKLGCETIQLMISNPRSWKMRELNYKQVENFLKLRPKNFPVFIHSSYLVNLASFDPVITKNSVALLSNDLHFASLLDAEGVIIHPGFKLNKRKEEAINRVAENLNKILTKKEPSTPILIENTSSSGSALGGKLEEIKEIIEKIEKKEKIGLCIDIAHLYQAGYNLKEKTTFLKIVTTIEKLFTLNKLLLLHLSDSKTPFSSKVDRHWHIGEGELGKEVFSWIVNFPKFSHLSGIIETPRKTDVDDIRNMRNMKKLRKK